MLYLDPHAHDDHHDDGHDDFGGLHRDLRATGQAMSRRQMIRLASGVGVSFAALRLMGCDTAAVTDDDDTGTGDTCPSRVPEETAGPYPGDGSNGPNVLNQTGVVRSDIRSSFGSLSGTAAGIPLNVVLTLVSASSCEPLAGYAVYLWHCDRAGNYSLYSSAAANQNYLRGVQAADANGTVTFQSIFPACYAGRWPHIHFEIYRTLTAAQSVSNEIATSQLALSKSSCDAVYATSGYEQSVRNLSQVTLATDGIFRDGSALQLASVTGNVTDGYTATLTIGVAV